MSKRGFRLSKRSSQWLAFSMFRLVSFSIVGVLFVILGFIVVRGASAISWEFLTGMPKNGMTE